MPVAAFGQKRDEVWEQESGPLELEAERATSR
jgi:hypothetical protein